MIRLVHSYVDLLKDKVLLYKDYNKIINTAYVLQPNTVGQNHEDALSPIQKQFLQRLIVLFDKFSTIHSSLFNERNQLFEIRLSLAVNLVED